MGAGLLTVKSGFILFIKDYQFSLQINTLERERRWWVTKAVDCVFKTLLPFLARDRAGTKTG